jgi:hypothetical protein
VSRAGLTTIGFPVEEGWTARVAQVETELQDICISILDLLDKHLIPSASTGESKVFYYKMKGDYHRYLAEFKTQEQREESAKHTLEAYKKAQVRFHLLQSCSLAIVWRCRSC